MPDGAVAEHWSAGIPETVTVEHEGKQVPLRDMPMIKETPDVATAAKRIYDTQTELGRRIRIPGKDANPDEVRAFKGKLAESGHLPVVPDSPDKYEIAKPEKLVDGVTWSDDMAKDFRATAHKLGLTNDQAKALVGYHAELMGKMTEGYKVTSEQAVADLKKEWGANFDKNAEMVDRIIQKEIMTDAGLKEFLEKTGLGNAVPLARMIFKFASGRQEDSTHIPKDGGGATESAEYQEALQIIAGSSPKSAAYRKENSDGPIHKFIEAAFKKQFPGKHETKVE